MAWRCEEDSISVNNDNLDVGNDMQANQNK